MLKSITIVVGKVDGEREGLAQLKIIGVMNDLVLYSCIRSLRYIVHGENSPLELKL